MYNVSGQSVPQPDWPHGEKVSLYTKSEPLISKEGRLQNLFIWITEVRNNTFSLEVQCRGASIWSLD